MLRGFKEFDGKLERKFSIKREEFKNILLELKSIYGYKNKFIENNFNVTFAIIVIENFLVLSEAVFRKYNVNVELFTKVRYEENTDSLNVYNTITRFYDYDLTTKTAEEIKNYFKDLSETEVIVLRDFLDRLPNDSESFLKRIAEYCYGTNNIDDSIREYKENNKEIKKTMLDFTILNGLFGNMALVVLKDLAKNEYLEGDED